MAQLPSATAGRNLIVCGLPRAITGDDLHRHFAAIGPIVSSKLMMNVKAGGHRGFGFVLFENADDAARAKAALNDTCINAASEGSGTPVGKSGRIRVDFADLGKGAAHTHIRADNVPVMVTSREVTKYFTQFGEVVSCSLRMETALPGEPPTMAAFVEFTEVKAAKAAVAKGTGTTPFEDKSVPLLVKPADSADVEMERRLHAQQAPAPAAREDLTVVRLGNARAPVQQLLFSRDASVYHLAPTGVEGVLPMAHISPAPAPFHSHAAPQIVFATDQQLHSAAAPGPQFMAGPPQWHPMQPAPNQFQSGLHPVLDTSTGRVLYFHPTNPGPVPPMSVERYGGTTESLRPQGIALTMTQPAMQSGHFVGPQASLPETHNTQFGVVHNVSDIASALNTAHLGSRKPS